MIVKPVIDLNLENIKNKGLFFSWKWSDDLQNEVNSSVVSTIINIFYINNVLLKSIKLPNPKLTNFLFEDFNNENVKVCLNISIRNLNNSTNETGLRTFYEQCEKFYKEQWSVSVSLGSSVAAFLVLLLIVSLIFLTKRLEKTRKIMHLKSSTKRKPRDSYIYVYQPTQFNEPYQNDDMFLATARRKTSEGNTAEIECASLKLDCESVSGIESLNSFSKEDSPGNSEDKNYQIIKCDCGLIHLVGTELECDNFLQYNDYENQQEKPILLAQQDTMSMTSESSL